MPQIAMSFLPSLIHCSLLLAFACPGLEPQLMHSSINAPSSTSPNCLVQYIACVQFMTSRNLMFHTLCYIYVPVLQYGITDQHHSTTTNVGLTHTCPINHTRFQSCFSTMYHCLLYACTPRNLNVLFHLPTASVQS